MIDWEGLKEAYDQRRFYSLQLEVGDRCEQSCIYCYMNALPVKRNTLSKEMVIDVLDDCRDMGISAIEWLGGEPLLRKDIFEMMEHSRELGMKNNIWTGGLPLRDPEVVERCVDLAQNGLISVHVSTLDPALYEELHPGRYGRDLDVILEGIDYARSLGYPPERMLNSVTYTGLQSAEDMIRTMDYFMEKYSIMTSLNVYHTYLRPDQDGEDLRKFVPDKGDVAKVYAHYSRQYGSDPLPMNCVNKQYCSATVALLCDGSVTPCATIRNKDTPSLHRGGRFSEMVEENKSDLIFERFRKRENLPPPCRSCPLSDGCFGCRSRAFASGNGIYGMDPRCFRSAGD